MEYRLPYYMAYPMPLQYDDERIDRRDFEYLKSMYPISVKQILPLVEEECDRMSYEGSMIYDEYPDQLQVRMMCNRICEKVKKQKAQNGEGVDARMLQDLVYVMLFHEMHQRRRKHRIVRRRFY